jgi:hypothetical protein
MSRTRRTFERLQSQSCFSLKRERYHRGISKKSSCCPIKFQCGSPKRYGIFLQFFCRKTVVAKDEIPTEKLYARIGQLTWRMTLKKSGLVSISERVKMVDTQNKLSIVKQCRLLKFIVAVFIIKQNRKV